MLVGTGLIREWLQIKEGDKEPNNKIYDLSLAVQDFVENYCHRKFEAKLYKTDPLNCYLDGNSYSLLYLPQYPVWYVNEVNIDADRDFANGTQIATDDVILYEQEGKIVSEAGNFTKGRRNVRLEYYAGYGSGTHVSHDGAGIVQFAVPYDLQQVIVEMVVQSFKDGYTAVHSIVGQQEIKFIQMLSSNSFWLRTINKYKNFSSIAEMDFYA